MWKAFFRRPKLVHVWLAECVQRRNLLPYFLSIYFRFPNVRKTQEIFSSIIDSLNYLLILHNTSCVCFSPAQHEYHIFAASLQADFREKFNLWFWSNNNKVKIWPRVLIFLRVYVYFTIIQISKCMEINWNFVSKIYDLPLICLRWRRSHDCLNTFDC